MEGKGLYIIIILIFVAVVFYIYIRPTNTDMFQSSVATTVKLDGVCIRPESESRGEIIMFRKDKWVLHDTENNNVKMGPWKMSDHEWFKDLPEPFNEGIDCVVQRPTDKRELLIFKGTKWLLWNFSADSLGNIGGDIGPYSITVHPWFNTLPDSFNYQIDAVCLDPSRPDTHLIFFKDTMWLLWDFKNDKIDPDGGPFRIGEDKFMPSNGTFPPTFKDGIDSVWNDPLASGQLFITKNNKFIRYEYYNRVTKTHTGKITAGPENMLTDPRFKEPTYPFIEDSDSVNSQEYISLDKSGQGHHSLIYNVENVGSLPSKNDKFDINAYGLYKQGKALKFNGKNSFMKMPDIKHFYTDGYTIAMFFRQSEFVVKPRKPRTLVKSDHDYQIKLGINSNGYLELKSKSKQSFLWNTIKSKEKIDSSWHHVTITQDKFTLNMYLDDKHYSTAFKIDAFPKEPVTLIVGADGEFPKFNNFFEGMLGDIRVYNKPHTQDRLCQYNPFCYVPEEEEVVEVKNIIDSCVYSPRGLTELDCFKDCYRDTDKNNCSVASCLSKCGECGDIEKCIWKQPIDYISPKQNANPDKKECQFNPYGMNESHCIKVCNGKDNTLWGGDRCTVSECQRICTGCEDENYCKWIKKEDTSKITVPNPPVLESISGNKEVVLYWDKPNDGGNAIFKYSIIIYKTNFTNEGIRLETPNDPNCVNCSYVVRGLENNVYYSIGITAINNIGMSRLSNIEIIIPRDLPLPKPLGSVENDNKNSLESNVQMSNSDSQISSLNSNVSESAEKNTNYANINNKKIELVNETKQKPKTGSILGKIMDVNLY